MVKYNFQLGSGDNPIRFKAHFGSKGDLYIVLSNMVKISIHKSGQTHLKPPSGGSPIIFDGHAFGQDIYKKKSQMFIKTTSDLPESPGAIEQHN